MPVLLMSAVIPAPVVAEQTRGHQTSNGGFAFRVELFNPANLSNMVGHGHARCTRQPHRKARCKLVVHLDGTIGGFGDLFLKGNLGGGDHTLNVAAVMATSAAGSPARRSFTISEGQSI